MKRQPELSIIIPAYNMANWLPYAVESCLWQSETRIEVIIVNDGSKDETPAIAAAYAKADSRVRVHNQENMGSGHTREVGQALSRGRFLTWLDADDFLDRDAARDMLAVADRDKVDMVCGNAVVFSDRTFNTRRYFHHPAISRTTFENPEYWKSKVLWRWFINTDFANKAISCHPPLKLGQDIVVMYELLTKVERFSQCPSFMYYFRQEHKGIDSRLETEVEHQLAHYSLVKDVLVQAGRPKPLVKYYSENYLRDLRSLMPRLSGPGDPWEERIIARSLEAFAGLPLEWFTQAFVGPEVKLDPELPVLAQTLLSGERESIRAVLARWSHVPSRQVNKASSWHTFRRRIKAMFAPLSRKARSRHDALATLARKRLGTAWPQKTST